MPKVRRGGRARASGRRVRSAAAQIVNWQRVSGLTGKVDLGYRTNNAPVL